MKKIQALILRNHIGAVIQQRGYMHLYLEPVEYFIERFPDKIKPRLLRIVKNDLLVVIHPVKKSIKLKVSFPGKGHRNSRQFQIRSVDGLLEFAFT